jgi:diguanylate cyclase (GGDEF)-like protein
MAESEPPPAPASLDTLRVLKRRIYLVVIPVGLFATALSWFLKGRAGSLTSTERIIFPAILAYILLAYLLLWRGPPQFRGVEAMLFVGVAAALVARLSELLTAPLAVHGLELADLLYWFPLVYVLAYLMFEARVSAFVSGVFVLGLAGLSLAHLAARALQPSLADFNLLFRFVLANAMYAGLLFAVAWLRERSARLQAQAEALTQLSQTDFLVNIANRRQIDSVLHREISRAERYPQAVSVILMDLDHFKAVNDRYGHAVGDSVLQAVAALAQGSIRPTDTVGRWGGEEFLFVVPEIPPPHARPMAERLRRLIEKLALRHVGHITASFGIADYRAGEPQEALLDRADAALYRAKQNGRNRVEVDGEAAGPLESGAPA